MHVEAGIGAENPRWVVWCKHTISNTKYQGGPPEETGNAFGLATDRIVVALPGNSALKVLNSAAASMLRLKYHAERDHRDATLRFDAAALEEIGDLTTGFQLHKGTHVMNVTLAVNAPQLDNPPRGSGMLVGPPPCRPDEDPNVLQAKAITNYSAKWPGTMAEPLPTRISCGFPTVERATRTVLFTRLRWSGLWLTRRGCWEWN